ncbi:MAG: type VII secretion protein EsaA [Sporolactobacillus sp.]
MHEPASSRLRKWGTLIIVFIIIVCISGALPRYLTPPAEQPQTAKNNTAKTVTPQTPKTGHLALVNEDQGANVDGQKLDLGNQVAPLFSNGDDYNWEPVSRSVAESGLKSGDYQAVFYIPSNFTANIFSFNQSKPKSAVITYQANPKLTAVDSAKVQSEFQKVKGTLNQQFSKIYWRVVSDKINYVNQNFADVLKKDKQYLQAMANFYKPSSQDMAQVFNSQLSQINELLDETNQAAKSADSKQQSLTETKKQIDQQTESMNKLNDQLNQLNDQLKQQIQTLQKTDDTNKQMVDDATQKAQDASTTAAQNMNSLVSAYQNAMQKPMNTNVTVGDLSTENDFQKLSDLYNGFTSNFTVPNSELQSYFDSDQTDLGNELGHQKSYILDAAYTAYNQTYLGAIDTVKSDANILAKGLINNQSTNLGNAKVDLDKSKSTITGNQNSNPSGSDDQAESKTVSSGTDGTDDPPSNLSNSGSSPTSSPNTSSSGDQQGDSSSVALNLNHLIPSLVSDIDQQITNGDLTPDQETGEIVKDIESNLITLSPESTDWALYDQNKLLSYYDALSDLQTTLNDYSEINAYAQNINDDDLKKVDISDEDINSDQSISADQTSIKSTRSAFTGELESMVTDAKTNDDTADHFKTNVQTQTDSISKKNSSTIKLFQDALQNQQSDLQKVENDLASNMSSIQQQTASIVKPIELTEPDITVDTTDATDADNGIAVTVNDSDFAELSDLDAGLQNVSDNESAILKDSQDVYSMVNGVQGDANQLSGSWGQNVNATAQLGNTIAQTLGNTGVPGNRNQNVYQQLTSPVGLAGLQNGNPVKAASNNTQNAATAAAEPVPVQQPFLTLLVVLIAGILTGYFSFYYRRLNWTINGLISGLLALISSAVIIYYGVQQYNLEGNDVLMWSVFTIGLVVVLAAWIHEAYRVSELAGVLVLVAMVVFFTLPLLRNSLDRFAYQNPAADVYLAIANGTDYLPFIRGMFGLVLMLTPVLLVIGIREGIHYFREGKEDETENL